MIERRDNDGRNNIYGNIMRYPGGADNRRLHRMRDKQKKGKLRKG